MHIPFNTMIKQFLESNLSNLWLNSPTINVYVRKGHHTLPPLRSVRNTLDVANVQVTEGLQGRGIFTDWLKEAEELAAEYGFDAVYVESLLNDRLADFLARRGYTLITSSSPPCYFRLT